MSSTEQLVKTQGLTPFLRESLSSADEGDINIDELRLMLVSDPLSETSIPADPADLFQLWFNQALKCKIPEANAMCIATVDPETLRPSARMVLLKELETDRVNGGFVFYTNYESRKSEELQKNPQAALTFFWKELSRSVRVEGNVEKVSSQMSDEYFNSRPVASRVAAVASAQSRRLEDLKAFESNIAVLDEEATSTPPKRPVHWGGWRIIPDRIEFWKGSSRRLHDRLLYTRDDAHSDWQIVRLQP